MEETPHELRRRAQARFNELREVADHDPRQELWREILSCVSAFDGCAAAPALGVFAKFGELMGQ